MEFTIRTFYGIGAIVMGIAVLGSIYNLFVIWDYINWGARMSSLFGSIIFQGLLSYFFYFMYKQTPSVMIQNPDLDKLLDDIQNNEKGGKKHGIRQKENNA